MKNLHIEKRIEQILKLAEKRLQDFPKEKFTLDYVSVFTKTISEYESLLYEMNEIGKELTQIKSETGKTYKLNSPYKTKYGNVTLIKIRKFDPLRPFAGAPDFHVKDYNAFKEKHYFNNNNISLITNKSFEMLEIKAENLLIYIPNKTLSSEY